MLVASAVFLAAFIVIESSVKRPMLELSLFRYPRFVGVQILPVGTCYCYIVLLVLLPLECGFAFDALLLRSRRRGLGTLLLVLLALERSFAFEASWLGVMFGFTSGRQRLRVNRLAAPIDMIAAGTSALIAMAAAANPTNHDGKILLNSAGTTSLAACTWTPAAIAI